MTAYEYTVIPAPNRGEKTKGARSGIERFAHALTGQINDMAAQGWEYVRAETLPCEERAGLTGRNTVYHNVLVFRRAMQDAVQALPPVTARSATPQPAPAQPAAKHSTAADVNSAPQDVPPAAPPDLQGEPQMRPHADAAAEPHDPPPSWPDGPAPTVQPDRPHVPERVPADVAAPADTEDALILDEDAPERPQFGQPMPKAPPPKLDTPKG